MGTDTNALECNESLSLIYIVYSQLIAIKKRKKCYSLENSSATPQSSSFSPPLPGSRPPD